MPVQGGPQPNKKKPYNKHKYKNKTKQYNYIESKNRQSFNLKDMAKEVDMML